MPRGVGTVGWWPLVLNVRQLRMNSKALCSTRRILASLRYRYCFVSLLEQPYRPPDRKSPRNTIYLMSVNSTMHGALITPFLDSKYLRLSPRKIVSFLWWNRWGVWGMGLETCLTRSWPNMPNPKPWFASVLSASEYVVLSPGRELIINASSQKSSGRGCCFSPRSVAGRRMWTPCPIQLRYCSNQQASPPLSRKLPV